MSVNLWLHWPVGVSSGRAHVRRQVSERDLNPYGCDLRMCQNHMLKDKGMQAGGLHMCPRSESPLTYMIDIALTKEFALGYG